MGWIQYRLVNVFETALRMLPWRCRTGWFRIGNPDRHSPVLLTGNFHLTVLRVRRALQGLDAHLLVANSRGINVWCAATGGLFTNHDVISVLKTSGVETGVDRREVILPQLAATGIEPRVIRQKIGWKAIWGPVEARDLPAFLAAGRVKSPGMRQVTFPLTRRLEMAVAWAFPLSLILSLVLLPFWRSAIPALVLLTWAISLGLFTFFPLYSRWLTPKTSRVGWVFFDFGRGGIQLILLVTVLTALAVFGLTSGDFTFGWMVRWGGVVTLVAILASIDLMGSTPVFKSGLHADRWLEVILDEEKCRGAGFCEQVCPRDCYQVNPERRKATRPRGELCVQCGACIVQCPFDALHFETPAGDILPPEQVRRFKLNLLGKRSHPTESGNRGNPGPAPGCRRTG